MDTKLSKKVSLFPTQDTNLESSWFAPFFVLQNSVKKKMTSLGLPTMPKLPKATKFWKKRSANISEYDPTFRVVYLGNVLTGWAKGKFSIKKYFSNFHKYLKRMKIPAFESNLF